MQVRECMTKAVYTIDPHMSTKQAFGLMKSRGIRHLPVVDGEIFVGIVTDRDLRRPQISDTFQSWNELYRLGDDIKVVDVMSTPVISIDAMADIREAAKLMRKYRIGALPVTDAHHGLAGILTDTDVISALLNLLPSD